MNQKLDVARVFERIFEIYRSQFTLLMPAALVLFIPVAVVNGLVAVGDVTLLGILIVLVASTVASFWFQGMVVEAARDILDGRRDYTLGSLLSSVTPVLGALVVAGILAGLGIGIGLILLIVPGLFLLTIWAVIAPVIVVERMGAIDAFRRSRALVKGHGWQVFGVIVVLFIVQFLLVCDPGGRGQRGRLVRRLRDRGPARAHPDRAAHGARRRRALLRAEGAARRAGAGCRGGRAGGRARAAGRARRARGTRAAASAASADRQLGAGPGLPGDLVAVSRE
jgi:hypothetical protein